LYLPGRSCLKNTGPGESNLIIKAIKGMNQLSNKTTTINANKKSKTLFIASSEDSACREVILLVIMIKIYLGLKHILKLQTGKLS